MVVSPLILNFVAECDGALYINARMDKKLYIYKPDSISPIAIVPITKSAVHKCTLMTEEYVEVHFEHSVIAEFKKGSNIYIDHRCFKLRADSYPERLLGKNGYKYVLKFYAPQHDMEDCRVKWLASSMKEITFDLTTTLASLAQLFCANMNYFLGVTTWKVGSLPTEDADATQHISFNGSTVWDKVDECAKVFGVEWWVEDNDTEVILNFGKLEVGGYEDFVEGGILKAVPATKRGQDADYGTRFYVFGGTQNIPEDYYEAEQGGVTNHISQKRLHLPEGQQYIDAFEDMKQSDIIEQTIILDDVYPKNTETVTGVEVVEREIDGTKSSAYVMICDNTPFDPKTQKIGTLGAVFTSGSLNGREFSLIIKENSFDKRFEIIAQSESAGGNTSIIIPNEHLKPAVDDTFVLTGIELPQDRIDEAEEELYNKAMDVVYERSHDTNIYECETNAPYCTKNDKNFAVGQKVRLVGLQFGEEGRKSRVMGFEKKLYDPYQAVYSVGNNSKYSRFRDIVSDINISIDISETQTSKKVGGLLFQSISNFKGLTKVASDVVEVKTLATNAETTANKASDELSTNKEYLFRIEKRLEVVEDNTNSTDISVLKSQVETNTQELGTLNETVVPVLSGRLGQAETTLETLTETTIPTLSQQALAAANTAKSEAIQESKDYADAELAGKADLENGKIMATQLPDYILGQLLFGGTITAGGGNTMEVSPSSNLLHKLKKPSTTSSLTINNNEEDAETYEGVYFIVTGGLTSIFGFPVVVGDWFISTGQDWRKVDNTDAVSSVAGLTGVITASALAQKLAATGDANELALKSEVDDNADASAEAIQSLQRQITNNTNGIAGLASITEDLDNRIQEHEGSLTSIRQRLIAVERTDVELRTQVTENSERLAAVEASNNVQLPVVNKSGNGGGSYPINSGVVTVFTAEQTNGANFQLSTSNKVNGVDNVWVIRFGIGASNTGEYKILSDSEIYSFKWANSIAPTFEKGKYYELSFRLMGQKFLGTWTSFGN